jgi:rSAM/selenodomain-associated transferase 1
MPPEAHILIFAKAPRAGLAKTRLIPALGPQGAAALAERLLNQAIHEALGASLGPVTLLRTPDGASAWADIPLPSRLDTGPQGEGDLGARLARGAARVLACGQGVIVMGTDCPGLTQDRLRAMAVALVTHDAVMIPVADGGYAALALSRFHSTLFEGVDWSTPRVAQQTRERIHALGWSLSEQPALWDIDEPDDLRHLPGHWEECTT